MKIKNKGRKIYKTKEKNYYGKSPVGKAFSVGLSILLIGGIGFIGYSVAEPIINYSKKKGDQDTSVSTQATTSAEENSLANGIITDNADPENPYIHQNINFETYMAAALKESDLINSDTLKLALDRLPTGQNIEYIEVPLKVSGGGIYYSSSVNYASGAQAFQNMLTLQEIAAAIKNAGYKPAAIVSTFNDNLLPVIDRNAGYRTYNTDEQWIDDDYNAGGKPWTTPYSQVSLNYISDIVSEVSSSGFEKIVCSDFVFPNFRQSDLDMLDPELASGGRARAMTSAANLFNDKIISNGSVMFIEVSAAELIKGNNDILQPMLLNVKTVILNIDLDELGSGVYSKDTVYEFTGTASDKAIKAVDMVEDSLADFNVAVRISGDSANMSEILEARDKLAEKGYKSFVIG